MKANGLEPSTLCTSSRYSSQLSYASECVFMLSQTKKKVNSKSLNISKLGIEFRKLESGIVFKRPVDSPLTGEDKQIAASYVLYPAGISGEIAF